jgi:ParB/RepB/Spo0J family partition protein
MLIEIEKIKVQNRIREDNSGLEELAADIKKNGLINPITVMKTAENAEFEYQLLAGYRRMMAVKSLGNSEVEASVLDTKTAEEQLNIEISENEKRKEFTVSEKVRFGELLEEIEKAKARERQIAGKEADLSDPGHTGRVSDAIGDKIGMSGRTYERAKYIVENADAETMEKVDSGELPIRGTYDVLRKEQDETPTNAAYKELKPRRHNPGDWLPPRERPLAEHPFYIAKWQYEVMLDEKAALVGRIDYLERQVGKKNITAEYTGFIEQFQEFKRQIAEEAARAKKAEHEVREFIIRIDHETNDAIDEYKARNTALEDENANLKSRLAEYEQGDSEAQKDDGEADFETSEEP